MQQGWPTISSVLPALQSLEINSCGLTNSSLIAMICSWTSLTNLRVLDCAKVTKLGWTRLAAAQDLPLPVFTEKGENYAAELEKLQSSLCGRSTLKMLISGH